MSRRSSGQLFVGRLNKSTRSRDLEDIFEPYGRLARCDIKYGAEMAYAFIDFEDRKDADDALRYENGREVCGSSIVVEWAKGTQRRPMANMSSPRSLGYDECYKCHRAGHWARDCPDDGQFGGAYRGDNRGGYRRSSSPAARRSSYSKRSRSRSRSRGRQRSGSRSRSRSRSQPSYNRRVSPAAANGN